MSFKRGSITVANASRGGKSFRHALHSLFATCVLVAYWTVAWAHISGAAPLLYQAGSVDPNLGTERIHVFDAAASGSMNAPTRTIAPGNVTPYSTFVGAVADASGNVWASAEGEQIYRYGPTNASLGNWTFGGAGLNGMGYNAIQGWLYVGNSAGSLMRLDASSGAVLATAAATGGSFAPTSNAASGKVLNYTGSRTAPVFWNHSADLSKSRQISMSGASLTNLSVVGLAWLGSDKFYVADYGGKAVYRFTLGGIDGDGLYGTASLDTSFANGGRLDFSSSTTAGPSGLATDGQWLYLSSYRGVSTISRYTLDGALVQANVFDTYQGGSLGNETIQQLFIVTVPEPSTWAMILTGAAWMVVRRKSLRVRV